MTADALPKTVNYALSRRQDPKFKGCAAVGHFHRTSCFFCKNFGILFGSLNHGKTQFPSVLLQDSSTGFKIAHNLSQKMRQQFAPVFFSSSFLPQGIKLAI